MAYKQQPKSPVLKALVGDQHKLPKVLKDAIEASPAKQTARPADPPKMSDAQRKEMAKKMSSTFAEMGSSVMSTLEPSRKAMKEATKKMARKTQSASPAKQSTYKGGGAKTDAQMADRKRRVDEGLTVRRKDYAPGKEGQASFNADRRAAFGNRTAKYKDIRTRLQSGEISKKDAMAERNAFAKDLQKSGSYKRTKADRNMGDAPTTFVISRKGIKRKVSDAEKASYESVSGGKSPAKQTKKNPSSGFDGYTKIASSKNSNVIAAKKSSASRKNPKSTYKFTKDKKTGETHLYQKG